MLTVSNDTSLLFVSVLKYWGIIIYLLVIDFPLALLQNLVSERLVNIQRLHEERVETLKKLANMKVCSVHQIKQVQLFTLQNF